MTILKRSNLVRFLIPVCFLLLLAVATLIAPNAQAQDKPQPESVTVAGTIQALLGCANDWAPECETTFLTYDADDDLWSATWDLPAGDYEYKAAINGTWDENYGAGAVENGDNIKLSLPADQPVTFFFDYKTGWMTDTVNSIIANVSGDFQSKIGCPADWAPDCLRTLLEDPDGDGVYRFSTVAIPAGDYQAKVALNQTWDENYGAKMVANGENIPFSVTADGQEVIVAYFPASHLITIKVRETPGVNNPPAAVVTEEAPAATEEAPVAETAPAAKPQPTSVTVAGTIQAVLGCANDWAPECETTFLTYDADDDLWTGTWDLPAGDYEYKAAINGVLGRELRRGCC